MSDAPRSRFRRAIRQYGSAVAWIGTFAVISTVVGIYILDHQRLRLPGQERYKVRIALANATALTPGFGQPLTVAGVKVGIVDDVQLRDGTAVVTASVDPHRLPKVYANARASLVPGTPSKDMQVDMDPGTPDHKELGAAVIPVSRTQLPVDSDELTTALDEDTREYLTTALRAAAIGLDGRGKDLRALFRALRPTLGQVRRINTALAARDEDLRRLVHNLDLLGGSFAAERPALQQLIRGGARALGASARNDAELGAGLSLLPRTLEAAQRTLVSGREAADRVPPTLTALTPATRNSPKALDATQPVTDKSLPLLRDQLRPVVRQAQPLARSLRPTVRRLTASTPDLTRVFAVLRYLTNELVHDPGADRSYLFWLAWLGHNANSAAAQRDGNGAVLRGLSVYSCNALTSSGATGPAVDFLAALAAPACKGN